MSNLGTFIGPQASIFYPINNNYLKLVVLSVEDDVKHPDREINSAADKVYLTVQCNTRKNKRKNNGNFVMWYFFVLYLLNQALLAKLAELFSVFLFVCLLPGMNKTIYRSDTRSPYLGS